MSTAHLVFGYRNRITRGWGNLFFFPPCNSIKSPSSWMTRDIWYRFSIILPVAFFLLLVKKRKPEGTWGMLPPFSGPDRRSAWPSGGDDWLSFLSLRLIVKEEEEAFLLRRPGHHTHTRTFFGNQNVVNFQWKTLQPALGPSHIIGNEALSRQVCLNRRRATAERETHPENGRKKSVAGWTRRDSSGGQTRQSTLNGALPRPSVSGRHPDHERSTFFGVEKNKRVVFCLVNKRNGVLNQTPNGVVKKRWSLSRSLFLHCFSFFPVRPSRPPRPIGHVRPPQSSWPREKENSPVQMSVGERVKENGTVATTTGTWNIKKK